MLKERLFRNQQKKSREETIPAPAVPERNIKTAVEKINKEEKFYD